MDIYLKIKQFSSSKRSTEQVKSSQSSSFTLPTTQFDVAENEHHLKVRWRQYFKDFNSLRVTFGPFLPCPKRWHPIIDDKITQLKLFYHLRPRSFIPHALSLLTIPYFIEIEQFFLFLSPHTRRSPRTVAAQSQLSPIYNRIVNQKLIYISNGRK